MKHLYILAAIAEVLALVSYIWYLPCLCLNSISDYLFSFAGFEDIQNQDEEDFLEEMENNEEKEEDND